MVDSSVKVTFTVWKMKSSDCFFFKFLDSKMIRSFD